MNEAERFAIPSRLDDPERWLFWTMDEAAVLMGPAVLGLAANAFVTGLVIGVGGWLVLRRIKRGGRAGVVMHGGVLVSARGGAASSGGACEPLAPLRRVRQGS